MNWTQLFLLSLVSRQSNTETRLLPYKLNNFEVGSTEDFNYFLSHLSEEKRQLIGTVSFGVTKYYSCNDIQPGAAIPFQLENCKNLAKVIRRRYYPVEELPTLERFTERRWLRLEVDPDAKYWCVRRCGQSIWLDQ